jgi:hypothetical protein
METINGTYPVQSLYFSCLNYLRINYKLINFTVLNDEIASDMAIIMRKYSHLKKFRMQPFRRFKETSCMLSSYFYKYHKEEMAERIVTPYMESLINSNNFIEYIPGVKAINELDWLIYDQDNNKVYEWTGNKYKYMCEVSAKELNKIYPDNKFLDVGISYIYAEDFFDQYPGLAVWAESIGCISEKLWVPEYLLE